MKKQARGRVTRRGVGELVELAGRALADVVGGAAGSLYDVSPESADDVLSYDPYRKFK